MSFLNVSREQLFLD